MPSEAASGVAQPQGHNVHCCSAGCQYQVSPVRVCNVQTKPSAERTSKNSPPRLTIRIPASVVEADPDSHTTRPRETTSRCTGTGSPGFGLGGGAIGKSGPDGGNGSGLGNGSGSGIVGVGFDIDYRPCGRSNESLREMVLQPSTACC
jgi:hypothetical protein